MAREYEEYNGYTLYEYINLEYKKMRDQMESSKKLESPKKSVIKVDIK